MAKTNINPAGALASEDIMAWYQDNPYQLGGIDSIFPLDETEEDTWRTISNSVAGANVAANPLSQSSPIPVAGRGGFKSIIGDFAEFGQALEWKAKELQKYEALKSKLASTNNPAVAQQLLNYYGNDLNFLRTSMNAERTYLSYAILSNACSYEFAAASSPYLVGLNAMEYEVDTWQKDEVTTSWSNAAALIIDDIQSVKDAAAAKGRRLSRIKLNKKWFNYVRNNTQVQKFCATLVQSLTSTQSPPTIEQVNGMLTAYFDEDIQFEVVSDIITRELANGTTTAANPFADGVAVFTAESQVGRFVYNPLYIDDPTREVYESFFTVGNYKRIDPNYNKMYAKAKGFPVIDTYADNFYLKINAVAW